MFRFQNNFIHVLNINFTPYSIRYTKIRVEEAKKRSMEKQSEKDMTSL